MTPDSVWQELAAENGHPTSNPDGVTTSNYQYWPRTQEQKAEALGVPFAEPVVVDTEQPYPEGGPPTEEDALAMLKRQHAPMDLVPGDQRIETQNRNLAAGGSLEHDELREIRTEL